MVLPLIIGGIVLVGGIAVLISYKDTIQSRLDSTYKDRTNYDLEQKKKIDSRGLGGNLYTAIFGESAYLALQSDSAPPQKPLLGETNQTKQQAFGNRFSLSQNRGYDG